MGLSKEKLREVVFQLLFSYDLSDNKDLEKLITKQLNLTTDQFKVAEKRALEIHPFTLKLDEKIREASHSYAFERIPLVERNILRLGVYELLYDNTIPPKVAISEAIRLCRKFSTKQAAQFVNAILDAILNEDFDSSTLDLAAELFDKTGEEE